MYRVQLWIVVFLVIQIMVKNSDGATTVIQKKQKGSGNEGKVRDNSFESKADRLSNLLPSETVTEGKYVHDVNRWAYKPDNSGKYVHKPEWNEYNGGYGPFRNPYEHDGIPYEHDGRPYEHDERIIVDDPFRVNCFQDKRPSIYREYGAPLFNSV